MLSQTPMRKLILLLLIFSFGAVHASNHANNGVKILAASDVSQSAIQTTQQYFDVAEDAWFKQDSVAWKYFHPILLVIVGSDMGAAIELEDRLCAEIRNNFPEGYRHSRCNPRHKDSNCQHGVCYITEYATQGGAGIASSRMNEGFHLMIMSSKRPGPNEEDYKPVTLHAVSYTHLTLPTKA